MFGKIFLGLAHVTPRASIRHCASLLVEHLAEQAGVSGIILDQEKYFDWFMAHPLHLCCGNLTLVSQKSLMLFTRLSNASSCTGLLR